MSSSNRTSSKGGKGTKSDKCHKADKSDIGKVSGDKQHVNKDSSKSEENLKEQKVQQLIEMTQRSEEEVCLALHECNFDVNMAINMMYESMAEGEWSVKKKKNRQPGTKQEKSEENATGDEWNENAPPVVGGEKEKPRSKSGGPPRVHGRHNDSRGWRSREKQENERNLDEGVRNEFPRERRGRPGGSTRGPGGGRGGRGGGRAGGRYPPRGGRSNTYNKPIDTWDNNNSNTWDNSTAANTNNTAEENWDDFPGTDEWSTEEYTGSLADTKVFTPSTQVVPEVPSENQHAGPLDAASHQLVQTLQINQHTGQLPSQSPVPMVGTLNAAQTQYLTQLTQQNSDKYGTLQTYQTQAFEKSTPQSYSAAGGVAAQAYNSAQQFGTTPPNTYVNNTYPVAGGFGTTSDQAASQQPVRTKTQRARVPPPSKIPASAVEMPGDLNSSIGYLDVQFGAMDFMSDNSSFEGVGEVKYGATNTSVLDNSVPTATVNLDLSSTNQNSNLDTYSPKTNTQSSISSALSQSLSNTDNIPTTEHVTGAAAYSVASRSTSGSATTQPAPQTTLDINKQVDGHSYNQTSTYNSYTSKNAYNPSTYSVAQTTTSSYPTNNSYVNSQTGTYQNPSGNSYQNSYSSATSYQSNSNPAAFPSITQANSYSANNQSYTQNTSQSVYGANTGLNNSSAYGNTSTSQYNNYSAANSHKIVKDSGYENASAASSAPPSTSNSVTAASPALSITQTTASGSKTTTTLAAKNSSSVVSNMPPGVTPVMSTPSYNMVQVPYFQQPVYSYEEMQLLQQRLPHMGATPYYDMSYQTPTTLAAVRDATLSNVGYSISDGRFTRGDNNASPVPSTLSQQTSTLTQGHQAQPILAGTAGPPYFFATPFNTIPNYPFYQLPAATNAHGTNSSTQYAKPGAYNSGYGSYDALSQTQDYSKGPYVSNTQGQKGTGGNASSTGSTGNDLSAMYGKSHTALGKVNSYEKQGFHSGTPPPFTPALHGSQNAGLAPSGTGYAPPVYIPTMAPHQHHSTPLMHQPLHQIDVRHQGRHVDSGNSSGQRSQASNQAKAGGKQYPGSYWNQA